MRSALALLVALVVSAGCRSGAGGPPPIAVDAACTHCGMSTQDLRVACEARDPDGTWRVYDSIECLLARGDARDPLAAYLADYDTRGLHRADSLWVVHGDFATPMGGGYAAFLSHDDAVALAKETDGSVARLDEVLAPAAAKARR